MVWCKILDKESYNEHIIFLKKVVMFAGERAGDRIRIMKYGLTFTDEGKGFIESNYIGLDQEQAITIFELMQEEL